MPDGAGQPTPAPRTTVTAGHATDVGTTAAPPRQHRPDRTADAPARQPRSVRRLLGRVPGLVWLIVGLHLCVTLGQTAIFPNFRSPDERLHADLVVAVAYGKLWHWRDDIGVSRGNAAGGFATSKHTPGRLHLADHPPPPRADRPSYRDAGGTDTTGMPANYLIQHPPLYYLLAATVLAVVPGWQDVPFDRIFLLLRYFGAVLTAALPILAWATARRLGLPDPLPIAAALAPLAIPELTHIESAVNNDTLLLIAGAALTLLAARVLTGDTSRRTAVGIGLVTTVALLCKGLALMYPAWIGLVYLVAAVRQRRRGTIGALLVAWAASVPGLSWWIQNRVQYGTVQPHGSYQAPDMPAATAWSDDGTDWLRRLIERLNTTFFTQDQSAARLHTSVWWTATVAGLLLLAAILVTLANRGLPRATTALLLLPVVGLFAIVAKGTWESFVSLHVYAAMQGRYLYAGTVGLIVVALAAAARLPARLRRLAPLVVLGFAAVMQGVSLVGALRLFWVPADAAGWDALARSFQAVGYWYAFGPAVLLPIVAGGLAGTVAVAIAVLRLARPGRPTTIGHPVPDG